VIVDYSATWCGPCKLLGPRFEAHHLQVSYIKDVLLIFFLGFDFRLEAVVAATSGKVHLAIVDIDELSDLALEGGVQAVPTVVAYKNGKVRM